MRRWLPIALLLSAGGIVAFVLTWRADRAEPVAAVASAPSTSHAHDPSTSELTRSEDSPERRAAEVAAQPTHAIDPLAAHLLVHVRGKTKGTPIVGAEVLAWPEGAPANDYNSASLDIPASEGQTDASGNSALDVRAGIALSVVVTATESAGSASLPVAALRPGQHAEITALLPDGDDAQVFGRVVDASNGAALSGALVKLRTSKPGFSTDHSEWGAVEIAQSTTSSDGTFELLYPAWREPYLRIEAEGYGARLSEPLKECSDVGHPLLIELARSASLRAHLIGADGLPLDALRVELTVDWAELIPEDQLNRGDLRATFPSEHWESKTDRDGWVSFADLPAQTSIVAYVHMGARVVQPDDKVLELAPGEAREVEWRMGAGCALNGVVLDRQGKPVTRIQVWLTKVWIGSPAMFGRHVESLVQQVATTDMEGRFEMVGVPKGEWFVGPAPDGPRYANEASVAPVAARVVIGEERTQQLTLRVDRGLFIRGRVLDPDGKPVCGAWVDVEDDARGVVSSNNDSQADGSFLIGPLPSGAMWLSARGYRCVESPRVRAQASASGIELRLRRGGTIRGRVVDAVTGKGGIASVEFILEGSSANARENWTQGGTEEDGTFESPPLLAGSYSIGSMTDDGRFGFVKGIGITTGAVQTDVVVQVSPGARLRLTYTGSSETISGRILSGDVVLNSTGPIHKGKPQALRLPAGSCVLELSDELGVFAREAITLRAGETRELMLGDKK